MTESLKQERNRIRQMLLAQRDRISPAEREQCSALITERLLVHPLFRDHQIFFIYCSYRSEVETTTLINRCLEAGKTVAVPVSEPKQAHMLAVTISDTNRDLACGYRNIREPLPTLSQEQALSPSRIEVAVIPGVVFDRNGHRLGYGGGFYDRFLAGSASQAIRIGLAFSSQLVERIPALPHDVPMDLVITEQEVFSWPRRIHATNRSV